MRPLGSAGPLSIFQPVVKQCVEALDVSVINGVLRPFTPGGKHEKNQVGEAQEGEKAEEWEEEEEMEGNSCCLDGNYLCKKCIRCA